MPKGVTERLNGESNWFLSGQNNILSLDAVPKTEAGYQAFTSQTGNNIIFKFQKQRLVIKPWADSAHPCGKKVKYHTPGFQIIQDGCVDLRHNKKADKRNAIAIKTHKKIRHTIQKFWWWVCRVRCNQSRNTTWDCARLHLFSIRSICIRKHAKNEALEQESINHIVETLELNWT